jgi:Fic family protein
LHVPVAPPPFEATLQSLVAADSDWFVRMMGVTSEVDDQGRYLHWDRLRHLLPPGGLTPEQWWVGIKFRRRSLYKTLSFKTNRGQPLRYCQPGVVQQLLHWLDLHASGSIRTDGAITDERTRNTYLIRGLMEEAINSSQLEGASTTQSVAKEMLRKDRMPQDKSEQMILNNYRAMQFIREIRQEPLTPAVVFELQRRLTQGTLNSDDQAGRFRRPDEHINVFDVATHDVLHEPPPAEELPSRLQALCDFANADDVGGTGGDGFLHPVVRAITLHFMLGFDHPFCDGNGRTARALFYWSMARQGYWLTEFLSISGVIKLAPTRYAQAFLHTETDDNDLTYFLVHQLEAIRDAVSSLHEYLAAKSREINQAEQMLTLNPRLKGKLNFRQLSLLRHAFKNPRFAYVIEEHQRSHGISYDIARKDLLYMSDGLRLLSKTRDGKRYLFVVPDDLQRRLEKS